MQDVVFIKVDVDQNADSRFYKSMFGQVESSLTLSHYCSLSLVTVFFLVHLCSTPSTAAAKYNVSAMPTFVFIKGGEVVDRLMGANPGRLEELIQEHK